MACGAEKRSKLRGMKPKKRFNFAGYSAKWQNSRRGQGLAVVLGTKVGEKLDDALRPRLGIRTRGGEVGVG